MDHEQLDNQADQADDQALLLALEVALLREAALLGQQDQDDTVTDDMSALPNALTEAERTYARQLKAAHAADNDSDTLLTDFQYAHHAVVDSHLPLPQALQKVIGLQRFRQQYNLQDTVEEGLQYLDSFMTQQAEFVLHLDVCEGGSFEAVRALDIARLNPAAAMKLDARGVDYHWKQFVCGEYYMHTACSPYLASIRQGIFEIADLDQLGSHNFSMEFEYRRHGELIGYYPLKFKTIMAYNTGYLANVSWNLMKPFLTENAKKSIQLGCQVVEAPDANDSRRRLAEFYLQPSPQLAQASILHRTQTMLQIRYRNEQDFRL